MEIRRDPNARLLAVFKLIEGIGSLVAAVLLVISGISTWVACGSYSRYMSGSYGFISFLTGLLLLVLAGFVFVGFLEGIGAMRVIYGGNPYALGTLRSIYAFKRVIVIIGIVLEGISGVISLFSNGGFAAFITLLIGIGAMVVQLIYYARLRDAMDTVYGSWNDANGYRGLSGIFGFSVFYAVLIGILLVVYECVALFSYSTLRYSDLSSYMGLIAPACLIMLTKYILMAVAAKDYTGGRCIEKANRGHTGMTLFGGAMCILLVFNTIERLVSSGYYMNLGLIVWYVMALVAFVLLLPGLHCRGSKAGNILLGIGAAMYTCYFVYAVILGSLTEWWIYRMIAAMCWGLLSVCAFMRLGGNLNKVMRIFALIAAILIATTLLVCDVIDVCARGYYYIGNLQWLAYDVFEIFVIFGVASAVRRRIPVVEQPVIEEPVTAE